MKIKTKSKISLAKAQAFEVIKGENQVPKRGIFSVNDCYWTLQIFDYKFQNDKFSALIVWSQIVENEIGLDEENVPIIEEIEVLMFEEQFTLSNMEIQTLWVALITNDPNFSGGIGLYDNYIEKVDEFVRAGIIMWLGIKGYFDLTSSDYEYID